MILLYVLLWLLSGCFGCWLSKFTTYEMRRGEAILFSLFGPLNIITALVVIVSDSKWMKEKLFKL
jgi:hypothetical protein